MEQIERLGDKLMYGSRECFNLDDAYRRFRDDYNEAQGKRRNRRLNRLYDRKERVHGWGMDFESVPEAPSVNGEVKVPSRLLGIVATGYCRIIGMWDMPEVDDVESYLDWLCSRGNDRLRLVGRRDKAGRTREV